MISAIFLPLFFIFFYAAQTVSGDFHVALSEQVKEDNNSTEHCLEKSANSPKSRKCQNFLDCCAYACYHKYGALTRRLSEQSGLNFYQLKEDDCVQNETHIVNASCICKNGANTFWTINRQIEPKIIARNATTKQQKLQQNSTTSSCESSEEEESGLHKQPLKVFIVDAFQLTNTCSQNVTNSANATEKPCELFARCCQSECARAKDDFQAGIFKSGELKGKTTVVSYSIEISNCEDSGNKTAADKSETSSTTIGEAQCSCNFTMGDSFRLDTGNPLKALFAPSLKDQKYTVVEGEEKNATTNSSAKEDSKNDTSSQSNSTSTTDSPLSTTTTDKNSHNNSIIPGPIANPFQQSQGQKSETSKNAASASHDVSGARTLLCSALAIPLLIATVSSFVEITGFSAQFPF